MVDAIVSVVLEQLISTVADEAKERVRLVTGVGEDVRKLQDNLEAIQAVVVDAEQREVKEKRVRLWVDKLKHASYDIEDVLDEWNTARGKLRINGVNENALVPQQKVCISFFPCASCFGFKQVLLRHDIAQKIKEINKNLDGISRQKTMFNFSVIASNEQTPERMQSTAFIDVLEVRGRDEEKNDLKSKLLFESSEQQNAVQIISLVGMGGIGKTTLAQFVFNDNDVINNFEKMIWVCVSDPFDEYGIAKTIIAALEVSDSDLENLKSLSLLLAKIKESIAGKKFFLVLDDVWTDDYRKWEPFHNCLMKGSGGSKILVTTRKKTVAIMMGCTDIISVKELSEEECWSLFKRIAFFGKPSSEIEQLEAIGRSIVGKCKGLPLAAKTIGSLLRFKKTREQWQYILDSEIWQLEELEKDLLVPLLLSYNDLPSEIKRCFSYCAIFSKDYNIKKDELINLWMAQGYIRPKYNEEIEMIGEEYFNFLASRSFFQDFEKDDMGIVIGCKMHDIIHDFAMHLTKNECFSAEVYDIEKSLSLIHTFQQKLRHLMLVLGSSDASFSIAKLNVTKLRSLLIHSEFVPSRILKGLFNQFTCLRALRISGFGFWEFGVVEILKGTQKLIHLRFLKLFQLQIKELPETCCELINLETLEVNGCTQLKRLPQGMEKLINLRHLIILDRIYLEYMPTGIERLTGLRTLSEFVVGLLVGEYANKVCKLEGLKGMNHLRGLLKIRMLGDLANVDEAKHVDLEEKKNLDRLELWFDNVGMTDENEENDEAITKVLRLPPNLEYLGILHYRGKSLIFPNWIESFNKLKKLLFIDCKKCESMPPLGQLPSLEVLTIWYMESVERVGDEFLGIENGRLHSTSSSSSSSSSVTAFPKLKHLTIKGWDKWHEWYFVKENVTIMPQLNSLDISLCNNLKSLPDQILQSKTLESLTIERCPILEQRFGKDKGDDWSKISHIPNIRIGHWYVQQDPCSIQ